MTIPESADCAVHRLNDIPPFTSLGGMPLTPERAEYIERAREMVPRLRERRMQTNRERRLPEETVAELHESGLLNVRRPREYGGVEMDNQTYASVIGELARGCGSTAWTVGIVNDIWFIAGTVLPQEGRHEFYASGLTGTAPFYPRKGAEGRKVDGGYQIDYGEWPWASGSQIAGWVMPRVNLMDEHGKPVDVLVPMVPIEQVEILDEWHTIAMARLGFEHDQDRERLRARASRGQDEPGANRRARHGGSPLSAPAVADGCDRRADPDRRRPRTRHARAVSRAIAWSSDRDDDSHGHRCGHTHAPARRGGSAEDRRR